MMLNHKLLSRLLWVIIQPFLTSRLKVEEGGFGHYLIGSYSSSIDFSSNTPGVALGSDFISYSGELAGDRVLPFNGRLVAGMKADVWILDVAAAYTFKEKILGAHYAMGAAVPYIWSSVDANSSFSLNLRPLLINAAGERIGPKAAKLIAKRLGDRNLERSLNRKNRDTATFQSCRRSAGRLRWPSTGPSAFHFRRISFSFGFRQSIYRTKEVNTGKQGAGFHLHPEFEDLGSLPPIYGSESLFLIAPDPHWLFCYRDIAWMRHPAPPVRQQTDP